MPAELDQTGFVLVPRFVDAPARDELLRALTPALLDAPVHHRSGGAIAARGLLSKVDILPALLDGFGLTALASQLLDGKAFPVDAIYFDKHARANWTVPGHQDRIVAVDNASPTKSRVRNGVAYGEPDASVLAQLIALRIHFDSTDVDTGALSVVPGTHRLGVLTTAQILELPLARYLPCAANAGDILAMRPLLLHRSSPSRGEGHRRVLHVVYAANDLDNGPQWRRSA